MHTTRTTLPPTTRPRRAGRLRSGLAATAVAAVSVAGLALGTGSAAAAGTVTVRPADLLECVEGTPSATGVCQEAGGGGTITAVADDRAIAGDASLELATPTDAAYTFVADEREAGKALSTITDLGYQTYLDELGTSPVQVTSLVIGLDPEGDGGPTKYVFWEPVYTGVALTTDTWQPWTPSTTPTGSGGWWTFPDVSTGTPNSLGFNQYTASFADVKAALPNAVVRQIGLNQGTGNPGLTTLVDKFVVNGTTVDFEQDAPATGPADLSSRTTVAPFSTGSSTDVQVVVTNNGPNPSGPTSVTSLALGYQVDDEGAGTRNENGTVTFEVPSLAPGTSAAVSFSLATPPGFRFGVVGSFVAPAPGQPDPSFFNNISVTGLASNGAAQQPQ